MRSEILDARAQDSVGRSDNEMCELDPGQFIDRARALIREQEMAENKPKREGSNKERDHGPNSLQPEGKHLAETLKQELNTAMSQVVDTVVKVFSAKPSRQVPQVFPPLQIPQARFAVNGETTISTRPTSACNALVMSSFRTPWTPLAVCRCLVPQTRRKPFPWWSEKLIRAICLWPGHWRPPPAPAPVTPLRHCRLHHP